MSIFLCLLLFAYCPALSVHCTQCTASTQHCSTARRTASTALMSGLCLIYSLPSQLPALPPCFTASSFTSLQASSSALSSLSCLLPYFTCSLIGLFSCAAACQPLLLTSPYNCSLSALYSLLSCLICSFFIISCLFPSLICLICTAHSTAAVKSLLLDDKPPLLAVLSLLLVSLNFSVAQPVLLTVLPRMFCRSPVNLCCMPLSLIYSFVLPLPLSVQPFSLDALHNLPPLQHLLLVVKRILLAVLHHLLTHCFPVFTARRPATSGFCTAFPNLGPAHASPACCPAFSAFFVAFSARCPASFAHCFLVSAARRTASAARCPAPSAFCSTGILLAVLHHSHLLIFQHLLLVAQPVLLAVLHHLLTAF
jgi:hypothetical protein